MKPMSLAPGAAGACHPQNIAKKVDVIHILLIYIDKY